MLMHVSWFSTRFEFPELGLASKAHKKLGVLPCDCLCGGFSDLPLYWSNISFSRSVNVNSMILQRISLMPGSNFISSLQNIVFCKKPLVLV